MTKDFWDPSTYEKFIHQRTQPALDLIHRLPKHFEPNHIVDLGSGPGNSTILLKNKWPHADITGVDNSINMLNQAQDTYPEINFIRSDIKSFQVTQKVELLFANASLQWLPHTTALFSTFRQQLTESGVLAMQMPNNFHSPAHQLIYQVLNQQLDWHHLTTELLYTKLSRPLYQASDYYNLLYDSGFKTITIWQTDYYQQMVDHQAILKWYQGTTLAPVLSRLSTSNQNDFNQAYLSLLEKHYPLQKDGSVLFQFKRFFAIANAH